MASREDHDSVMDFLWDVSDPGVALQTMKENGNSPADYSRLEARFLAEESKKILRKK